MIYLQKYESGDSVLNTALLRDRFNALVDAVMALQNMSGDAMIGVQDYGAGYVINWRGPKSFAAGGATEVNEVTSDVVIQPSTDGTKLTLVYPQYKVSASQSQTAFDGFNVYATVTYWDSARNRYSTVIKRFIKTPTVASGWTPRGQYGFISFQGRLLRTDEALQLAFALVDTGGDKKGLQMPTSSAGAASVFNRQLAYYEVVSGIVSVTQLHYGVMAPVTLVAADGAVADLSSIIAYGGDSIIATN